MNPTSNLRDLEQSVSLASPADRARFSTPTAQQQLLLDKASSQLDTDDQVPPRSLLPFEIRQEEEEVDFAHLTRLQPAWSAILHHRMLNDPEATALETTTPEATAPAASTNIGVLAIHLRQWHRSPEIVNLEVGLALEPLIPINDPYTSDRTILHVVNKTHVGIQNPWKLSDIRTECTFRCVKDTVDDGQMALQLREFIHQALTRFHHVYVVSTDLDRDIRWMNTKGVFLVDPRLSCVDLARAYRVMDNPEPYIMQTAEALLDTVTSFSDSVGPVCNNAFWSIAVLREVVDCLGFHMYAGPGHQGW